MRIAQYRVGLNLQVKPVRVFVILDMAILKQVAGNLGICNLAQRLSITNQAMQTPNVGFVVRFRVSDVNVQTIAALLHCCQILTRVDDERPFGQKEAVLVHQRKGQWLVNADGLDADRD
jgi:hypothetical protein